MNLDLGPLVNHLLGTQKGPRSIEEVVADSYHFSRKKVLEELRELNDMGFSNKLICEILDMDIRVLQRFLKGKKPHEVNFIRLKEGLAEIRKQHEQRTVRKIR